MENKFTIKLADRNIEIKPLHDYVREYCKDYLTEGDSDFCIEIKQSDIDYERKKSESEDIKEGIPLRHFNDEYLETLSVYRKIADKMTDYDTILFHGSVIAVDGTGYLFTAKSGTGKSTHTGLWREYFGERAFMVNDDKPLIRITESGAVVYGTPWDGKHRLSRNTSVPLKAVCILERDTINHIEKVNVSDVYNMIIQQIYKPTVPDLLLKVLKLADRFADNTQLYKLGCNMNIEAAETAYNGMKG